MTSDVHAQEWMDAQNEALERLCATHGYGAVMCAVEALSRRRKVCWECEAASKKRLQTAPNDVVYVTCDTLEVLAGEMGNVTTGAECERMLRNLIGRPKPPPNPHPQGTYLWAKEEHSRGRVVWRLSRGAYRSSTDVRPVNDPNGVAWSAAFFSDDDFSATDWEVVK